jgi:hypothetical protein
LVFVISLGYLAWEWRQKITDLFKPLKTKISIMVKLHLKNYKH